MPVPIFKEFSMQISLVLSNSLFRGNPMNVSELGDDQSHHTHCSQWFKEKTVVIGCIWETHQGALWSFYLTNGKKNSERQKQNVSLLLCVFSWQHDNPTARISSPFPLAKLSGPYQHTEKEPKSAFCSFWETGCGGVRGGGVFSTSVSSIHLWFAAAGQETHCSMHQPLTPPGASLGEGLEVLHTSSGGALKTWIALKPSLTCCVRQQSEQSVFTLGIVKKKGKGKNKSVKGRRNNETWPHQRCFDSVHVSVRSWLHRYVLSHWPADQFCQESPYCPLFSAS